MYIPLRQMSLFGPGLAPINGPPRGYAPSLRGARPRSSGAAVDAGQVVGNERGQILPSESRASPLGLPAELNDWKLAPGHHGVQRTRAHAKHLGRLAVIEQAGAWVHGGLHVPNLAGSPALSLTVLKALQGSDDEVQMIHRFICRLSVW